MIELADIPAVDVVEGCDSSRLSAEVLGSEVPLRLKGLVSSWPAVKACSTSLESAASYLSRFWIERPVTAYVADADVNGRFFYNEEFTDFNFKRGSGELSFVFEKLQEQQGREGAQSIYVGSTPVDEWLPGFRQENDVDIPADDALASFWLGTPTRVSAHFDFPNNVACCVAGRRRFTLFPPEQVDNLYVGPLHPTPSGQAISVVDFASPDFGRFPRFAEALEHAVVCELEPGDAVFIPGMWWHHVDATDDFNMLVNYWWCDSPLVMGSPTTALLHAILSVRDLPPAQRRAWKKLFDHYVFDADEDVYAHIPETGRGWLEPLSEDSARQLRAFVINKLNH